MPNTDYRQLKGITNIGDDTMMVMLENNLKTFYDWTLLTVGGWTDINIPTTGAYGGEWSTLRLVDDPQYEEGQVWEGARKDWVWETGVEWSANIPVIVTGVEVDDIHRAFDESGYEHHINFPLGRVVFDSALATSSVVKCTYSYRTVQVYVADNAPWFQELQYSSNRVDSAHYSQLSSGDWALGAQHRVQFPAIVIEVVPRGQARPYEIGNGSIEREQDVLFHVVAETRPMRNKLLDIIAQQTDKTIWLFDTNQIATDEAYPLDFRGMLTGTNMYPDFVDDSTYRWRTCRLEDATISEVESLNPYLYQGTVRTTAEVVLGGV